MLGGGAVLEPSPPVTNNVQDLIYEDGLLKSFLAAGLLASSIIAFEITGRLNMPSNLKSLSLNTSLMVEELLLHCYFFVQILPDFFSTVAFLNT